MARDSANHEAMIARLLSRPFTIPIPGYSCEFQHFHLFFLFLISVIEVSGRVLGMARSRMRVAMFDPYAENAVVLYAPPPLSVHEQMNLKEEEKLVRRL